jgi:diphthamide biosynthesis methyltransferase
MIKRLRVKAASEKEEQIVNIEEAKNWDFGDPHALVVVECHLIRCYDELLEIAFSDNLKDKEIIDIDLLMMVTGG